MACLVPTKTLMEIFEIRPPIQNIHLYTSKKCKLEKKNSIFCVFEGGYFYLGSKSQKFLLES